MNCLNPQDIDSYYSAYHVSIADNVDTVVFANNEQEALDFIIDDLEENHTDEPWHFISDEEIQEGDYDRGEYISGGNHCRTLNCFTWELNINKYQSDNIVLSAEIIV